MHHSYAQTPRRQVNVMELKEVLHFVSPKVREAALQTAAQLTRRNIRHALAGGLTVSAYGYVHAAAVLVFSC